METTKENVKHPSHYNQGGIECFDVIKAALGEDGFQAFCHGNAIKYTFRAKYKGKYIEDMKKARFYIDQIIEHTSLLSDKSV